MLPINVIFSTCFFHMTDVIILARLSVKLILKVAGRMNSKLLQRSCEALQSDLTYACNKRVIFFGDLSK